MSSGDVMATEGDVNVDDIARRAVELAVREFPHLPGPAVALIREAARYAVIEALRLAGVADLVARERERHPLTLVEALDGMCMCPAYYVSEDAPLAEVCPVHGEGEG